MSGVAWSVLERNRLRSDITGVRACRIVLGGFCTVTPCRHAPGAADRPRSGLQRSSSSLGHWNSGGGGHVTTTTSRAAHDIPLYTLLSTSSSANCPRRVSSSEESCVLGLRMNERYNFLILFSFLWGGGVKPVSTENYLRVTCER